MTKQSYESLKEERDHLRDCVPQIFAAAIEGLADAAVVTHKKYTLDHVLAAVQQLSSAHKPFREWAYAKGLPSTEGLRLHVESNQEQVLMYHDRLLTNLLNLGAELEQTLRERSQRAHSYGQRLAQKLERPSSHQGDLWQNCPSSGCAESRRVLNEKPIP